VKHILYVGNVTFWDKSIITVYCKRRHGQWLVDGVTSECAPAA